MPFGLGFFATAGVSAAAGSYELITSTILTGSQSSVTFSNLGDYSSTYKHLQIRIMARSTRAAAEDQFRIYLNNDNTSGRYATHRLGGNGSSVTSGATPNETRWYWDGLPGANASANLFGASVIDILDAYENKNKTVRCFNGSMITGSSDGIQLASGGYFSTSSLTAVNITAISSFAQYSRFSLFGLKG